MSNIATTDARPLFTKDLVAVYRQMVQPTSLLRSYFKETYSPTKEVSIEVQRGFEMVAVDVVRGTEGTRNKFPRSTEKIFVPPLYDEYFDMTELDLYDRLMGSTQITGSDWANFVYSGAMKLKEIMNKIERAAELQCAQVLQTGIVTLKNGDNIDFKRKAASIYDPGTGSYWANTGGTSIAPTGTDPYAQLQLGCDFLRKTGKAAGGRFNLICGAQALADLKKNNFFLQRQNLFNMKLDNINPPQRDSVGGVPQGTLSVGNYELTIWGYPQYYNDPVTGVLTPYISDNTVVMLPDNPEFVLSYAAVPQLLIDSNGARVAPFQGKFLVNEFPDFRNAKHDIDVKSAFVAIPVAVDRLWTMKTGAGA